MSRTLTLTRLSLTLATAALLIGCGQRQDAAPPPAAEAGRPAAEAPPADPRPRADFVLTDADDGAAVALRRGQVVELRLLADRHAGFTWIPTHNPRPTLGTDGAPQYHPDPAAAETAPGIEEWRFVGREAGHVHLVFEYRRPFEPGQPAQRSIMFHFDVE